MDRTLDRTKKLNRRGSLKHINYDAGSFSSLAGDLSVSTSSLMTRSLELPDSTSFRIIGGGDKGETDRIYQSLAVSGPDDLAISFDAWEAKRSCSDVVNRFQAFEEGHANEKASEKEYGEKNINRNYQSVSGGYESEITGHDDAKEDLLEKCLTTSDVGNSDRLVVAANEDAGKYFLLATVLKDTDSLLRLEDEEGKAWLFGFSYLNVSQCCEFTKGWSSYVGEKQLGAGDFVFFQRNRTDSSKLFIGCRKSGYGGAAPGNDAHESFPSAVLNPTSPGTSNNMLELREELKEVETPLQLGLPEHSITGFNTILVISSGDNQDSEETYFTSYIFNELCLRGFAPLRYDIKKSSVTVNPKMLYRSRVSIIIFSMNFAHSTECLDGIVEIMDHLKANDLALVPVFFKVRFSDVRGQSGSFEKALTRLANSVQASQVLKWRAAMIELTSITRYQYLKGDEVMLAKNIVRDVCLLLSAETNRNLIGMGSQLKSILSLLNCSQSSAPQIIGLWGMAGIGKSTISREIFRTQAERYDVCYFLPDFHLMCQTKGLSHLREEFFSKIFGEEKVFIDACDTNLSFTRDMFFGKKVLIVLDGVSNARDAEVLVGGFGWFSGGHTIILTSRNRQNLVQCNAKEIYEIQKLSEPESLHLCCQFATEKNWKGRIPLISELVNYANGNPLALQVLALSIQKQFINDEKQHLRRLRQHPPINIQDAFRISFNGQDDDEKSIFLDLACFFRGEDKNHVVNILDDCGFFTELGIYGLIDESLISLVDNKIEMPNIFQDAGRFVVCQEHEEAGKRSRLWDSNDIVDVLTNNSGTEAIEGIFLDASSLTFDLSSTVFERMYRLRLLKLHYPTSENHCKVCLPQGLHSLPDELRLLHWERYPLGSLPRNFNPKNLVELNMPYSNLTKLWKGTKNLAKLKRIILSHSRQLTKFPRLSKARNLEHIDLEGCTSLVKVNSSIIDHHKLTSLSLKDCSHLRVMPTTVHLESLEVLNLSGCSELEDLQDFSPNLKELYLAGTAIVEMPSSLEDLTRLVTLDLENCEKLQHLPPGISNLKAMMTLNLSGCSNLKSLPILDALFLRHSQRLNTKITMEESVPTKLHSAILESRLDGAETLLSFYNLQFKSTINDSLLSRGAEEDCLRAFESLSRNGITQAYWSSVRITFLPSSMFHSLASRLYCLVSLSLCNAFLVDIPEELCWLPSVRELDLGGNSFSQIPESIKDLRKLHSLRIRHCKNLTSLPELPRSLEILNAHGCVSLKSFPSSFEQLPRHYTFSNCFALSPEVVRKYLRKVLDSVEVMAEGHLLERSNVPAFSICIPASSGHKSAVNFQAGSSFRIELTPGMLKTLSGVAFSVVVKFRDKYSNAAGVGIKCICRKTRTDLSPRLERIFRLYAPEEAPTVEKDHMFLFGYVTMNPGEGNDHDVQTDLVSFEFHPVNGENQLIDDRCTVKRCAVHLITGATCDTALSEKRSASCMDPVEQEVSVPLNLHSAVQESRLDGAEIQRSLSSPLSSTAATIIVHDQEVKEIAMARLEEEFRKILLSPTSVFDPDSLFLEESSVSSHSSRTEVGEDTAGDIAKEEEKEDSNPADGSGSSRLSRRRCSYSTTSSIREMDLISPEAVSDLRSIVQRMVAAGYLRECIQVYVNVRKAAMKTILKQLGIVKMSIGSLEWEVVQEKIRRWIRAAKVCIRIVFSSEKRLCEELFDGICASMDETCFMETVKTSALRLFTFPEAISISRRAPEKLFKILDLHDAMSDMLPDIEAIFDSDLFNSIRGQAAEIQARLAEAARGILSEFEDAVLRDTSVVPVPGGNIHPLTRYVMNYISVISEEYKQPLNDLIMSNPSTGSDPNTPVMDFTELEGKSPLALHLIWLIVVLHFKLEEKSHHYRDTSLAHIFVMNNIHYIVQKVKRSPELSEMIGDHYLRKLIGIFRYAATNYQKSTWVRVLNSLRDEGLHVSGSFSSGVSKNALRERFKEFNAMFEEVHRTQSIWSVPDAQLREELRISLSDHLTSAYRSFLRRFRGHIESGRHPEDYLKYSVEDVEKIVLDLFEGYTTPPHLRRR